MTRRSITAVLGSLLIGLLFVVNAPAVTACELDSAGNCVQSALGNDTSLVSASGAVTPMHILAASGLGQEQFEALPGASDTALFAAPPVHILGGNGMGQEQFEATEESGYGTFVTAVPTNATVAHVESGYAPENYAQMASVLPTN